MKSLIFRPTPKQYQQPACYLAEAAGKQQLSPIYSEERKGDIKHSKLSNELAKQMLGMEVKQILARV